MCFIEAIISQYFIALTSVKTVGEQTLTQPFNVFEARIIHVFTNLIKYPDYKYKHLFWGKNITSITICLGIPQVDVDSTATRCVNKLEQRI